MSKNGSPSAVSGARCSTLMANLVISGLMASMLAVSVPQSSEKAEEVEHGKAQTAPDKQDIEASQKLLGRYYLRGVMETASGLQLSENGSFQWYLIVGGLDILSGGSWSRQDEQVMLIFDPPKEGARYDPIGTVMMRIDGENLVPSSDFGGGTFVKAKGRSDRK